MSKLAGVPEWAEVDFQGNPHTRGVANTPKDAFVVYVTRAGRSYHRRGCRHLHVPVQPMNIRQAKQKGFSPCGVCRPLTDVPEWAIAYRKIWDIQARYKIPMDP